MNDETKKNLERFLQYVQIDTQSDDASTSTPSASKELNLTKKLAGELEELGIPHEIDEFGRLYGWMKGEEGWDPIGLNAHVDTALECSGANVKPRIIEKYDGGPVGIETIAAAIGEDVRTIEDVCEPFLLQVGLLQRTPRGRKVSPATYRHLGYLTKRNNSVQQIFF